MLLAARFSLPLRHRRSLRCQGGGHAKARRPAFARGNTLVRIDPATNKVSAVIDVGLEPFAAAGGHSVWTYNRSFDNTISEVDAARDRVRKTTTVSGITPAGCCGVFTGPVLAADASAHGSSEAKRQALLTHVVAGGGRSGSTRSVSRPTGVAVGQALSGLSASGG